jgi:hypothetical protein
MEEILIINLNNIVELAGQIYLLSDSEERIAAAITIASIATFTSADQIRQFFREDRRKRPRRFIHSIGGK